MLQPFHKQMLFKVEERKRERDIYLWYQSDVMFKFALCLIIQIILNFIFT